MIQAIDSVRLTCYNMNTNGKRTKQESRKMKDLRTLSKTQLNQMAADAEAKGYTNAANHYRKMAEATPDYQAIQMQGIGFVPAKCGDELKVGDVLVLNYGYRNKIVGLLKETKTFLTFQVEENGKLYERRIGKGRLVGVTKESL